MLIRHPDDLETESFAGLLLRHRGRTGLTQRDLAARLGTTRRSIQDWDSGAYHPSAERLQALILVLLETGGLTVGREGTEARALWAAALREAPRMHTPLDEVWLDRILAERATPPTELSREVNAAEPVSVSRGHDWGEAPDVIGFVGRAEELTTLRDWVLEEQCRLAAVLGMGGIGKTALASRLAQEAASSFQRVYWRSLRDAPPASEWTAGAIAFLSAHQLLPPKGDSPRIAALLQLLREQRSLLVLDNFETVLERGQQEGRYHDGFAGYGALLQAIGETRHRSCMVVTSREAPPELAVMGGGAVRRFQLGGLGVVEGRVLLTDKQLSGNDEAWANLIARFGGNGLALKVVGESIRQVFDGDISAFLNQSGSGSMFGGIRRLLAEQIERSSAFEQKLLRVLAVEREPVTLAELITDVGQRVRHAAVLEAIEALRRRSLLERSGTVGATAFTLQSVVLEYVTDRLVEEVSDEITHGQPFQLVEQPLIKAQAKDYVRQTQERLIGEPVLQQVRAEHGNDGAEKMLLALLDGWRNRPDGEQGYGPGNVVNLLRLARGDLGSLDLTHLALRQAYLAGVEAQDASLAGGHLTDSVLAEAFGFPASVALSPDGAYLAAGTATGEVHMWRVADRTLLLAVRGHAGAVRAVALRGDGGLVASGSLDGTVKLWEAASGQLLANLQAHTGGIYGVALSGDGRLLASASLDATIKLWEVPSGQLLATLQGHTGAVWDVALSADGQLVASGGVDGTVRLWEAASGRPLAALQDHESSVLGVELSADGRLVASASQDGSVKLWELPSGQLLASLQAHNGVARALAVSANGRLVASSGLDGMVKLWEAPTGRLLATLHGHSGLIYGVALSGKGGLVASGSLDGTIKLWEAPSGQLLATLQGHTGAVRAVTLSQDGGLLVSGAQDQTVRAWEVSSGRLLGTLQGHTGAVYGVALSGDGRLLASGSLDGVVKLWEVATGRLLATLQGHTSAVWGVAMSGDGGLLASGSFDGTVKLWEAPSGRLLTTVQAHRGSLGRDAE